MSSTNVLHRFANGFTTFRYILMDFIKLSSFFIAPPSLTSFLLCRQPVYNVLAFLPYQTLKFIWPAVLRPLLSHSSLSELARLYCFPLACCHIQFGVDLEMGLMCSNVCCLTASEHSDVFSVVYKFIVI